MSAADEPVAERNLLVPRPIDLPTAVPLDAAADLSALDEAKIFAAPRDPDDRDRWREVLTAWRSDARARLDYDGRTYDTGPSWAARCFTPCLVWLWDERLYDRASGEFTVDGFLERGVREFGGFDAVVLWHAYPVIGIDERNQWDYYRDVPNLADIVDRFHRRGVEVFVNYNPWDVGTRRVPGSDAAELAAVVSDYGFDGVFLDTLKHGDPDIIDALAATTRPIALEGESRVPLAGIAEHALSWAQWFSDTEAPGVLRAHWFERRHMMHHTRRWNRDHSVELQSAWVNGCGVLVWDDVFGVWVGWNARDRATLRAMRPVQRAFGAVLRDGTWTPLCALHPSAESGHVYAHRYDLDGTALWTLVNRSDVDYVGPLLADAGPGEWFDVTGDSLVVGSDGAVHGRVPARSIAGIVAAVDGARLPNGDSAVAVARRLATAAAGAADLSARPQAAAFAQDAAFPARVSVIVTGDPSSPHPRAPSDTVVLPAGRHWLAVRSRRRETGQADEAPWVEAWKPLPPDLHAIVERTDSVVIGRVAVDRLEVSAAQYARFCTETGYRPRVPHRHVPFVSARAASDDAAVTYVDLDDARAYARWRGARLPTPAEWQLAQTVGADRRKPLVWNLTDSERTDGITRYVLLKGGSDYAAAGSSWYVDGGPQAPEWELKFVLPGGGLQRSSRIGFRCAYDLVDEEGMTT